MPVEKQVAIAVHFLVHKGSSARIATIFGVGKPTACKAIIQVVIIMELVLLKKTVYLRDCRKMMEGFEAIGFPQVTGAIDGCHCNIISPVSQG
ncbi:hypothetical protein JD844_016140 [Phrynosoma platyrhinos]|uniref:Nuclease HARBI1 n=1 Tax=Phrynosoma platyrhinos TaxID=52577 RepID=A0ABQ7SK90_PHRPL|nr:hypothetical protein JD844_016140 [Phrynosoma platyrhinos]